ncbi:MAG: VWA domain-containing protein [Acidobacteriaceae bacterium]|nr:VWA domain-containing protein [Acidobacteriaceae bacterium]
MRTGKLLVAALWSTLFCAGVAVAQDQQAPSQQKPAQTQPAADDSSGPDMGNDGIVLPKKKDDAVAPPPAPAEEKVDNPGGATYSMRVDVPIVNLDVNVLLDKTHQFVPGLKPENFLVVEDGKEQEVSSVKVTRTPITVVLLLEFAANSYFFIRDMQNAADGFFRTMQPEDYVAVETYDIKPHVLTDFTNNKDTVDQALNSLIIPGFRETNQFDALYDTLDRLTRIEGRKYIVLISTGVDTMSHLTLDQMYAKVKATPNVSIFTISTGQFVRTMADARGAMGPMTRMTYLQADNQMKTFADMTGGMSFRPIFQGELPDIFSQINESIRNEYVVTYKPTNTKNDGSYRKVKVYLVDAEGKPLKMQDEKGRPLKYSVIHRDGYKARLPVE